MEETKYRTFIFVSDGDIFHTFKIADADYAAGIISGLLSQPIVVEVTGQEFVYEQPGWKYINGEFVQDFTPTQNPIIDEDDYEVE
jgi:hypothetical protein